jgi:hypothetical protein
MGARRENLHLQKDLTVSRHHEALTANGTKLAFKARAECLITRIEYANEVGLAEDATNAFKLEVKNGATVLATLFDTDADEAGTNTLGTAMIVATPGGSPALANNKLAAGDTLSLVFTEDGAATLPPGDITIYFTEL